MIGGYYMKKVLFTNVRNEEDIIESFVRFHAKIFDHIYISDNLSVDNTGRILDNLVSEGLNLTVWKDDDITFNQNIKTTKAFKQIVRDNNDIDSVFFLDVDEFLVIKPGFQLDTLDGYVYTIERYDFLYFEDLPANENVLAWMKYRKKKATTPKSMIKYDKTKVDKTGIGNGNHHVYYRGKEINDGVLPDCYIAHYPIRSVQQFTRKNIIGWTGLVVDSPKRLQEKKPVGVHWRNAYNFIMDKQMLVTSEDLINYLYGTSRQEVLNNSCMVTDILGEKLKYKLEKSDRMFEYQLVYTNEKILEQFLEKSKDISKKQSVYSSYDTYYQEDCLKFINGSKIYAIDTTPYIRRVGNVVELSGALRGIKDGKSDVYLEFPEQFAPRRNIQYSSVTSHGNTAYWQVQSNGLLKLLGTTFKNADENSWYPFHIQWMI